MGVTLTALECCVQQQERRALGFDEKIIVQEDEIDQVFQMNPDSYTIHNTGPALHLPLAMVHDPIPETEWDVALAAPEHE